MLSLADVVDRELEDCGFSKVAYNPFTGANHERPAVEHDRSGAPIKPTGATDDAQADYVAVRGREHKTSPVFNGHPAKVAAELAGMIPTHKLLANLIEKRSSRACGLKSRSEVFQAFTGSDAVNRIKLAGIREMALKYLPDELMLPLVRRLKGTAAFPAEYADELEALMVGRGLRQAAATKDVAKARELFEGMGGTPTIDQSMLATLQNKADLFEKLKATGRIPSESTGLGFVPGLAVGAMGTMAAGRLLEGMRNAEQPAAY